MQAFFVCMAYFKQIKKIMGGGITYIKKLNLKNKIEERNKMYHKISDTLRKKMRIKKLRHV